MLGTITPKFDPLNAYRHFVKHKQEFGLTDVSQYEALAFAFIQKPLVGTGEICKFCPTCSCFFYGPVHECVCAADGRIIRYDTVTEEFSMMSSDGFVITYYKPNPIWNKEPNIRYYHNRCKP